MSNSQRRTEFRQRRKTHPGPTTSWDAAAQRDRVRRLGHLEDLRRIAVSGRRAEDRVEMAIPTSGPDRRRAKARRNARAVRLTELLRRVDRVRSVSRTFAFPYATLSELHDLDERGSHGDAWLDLERRWRDRARVVVDPNQVVDALDGSGGRWLRVSFDRWPRPVYEGEAVTVIEADDELEMDGLIVGVDRLGGIVYVQPADGGRRAPTQTPTAA